MTQSASLVTIAECLRADLDRGPSLNVAGQPVAEGECARITATIQAVRGYVPRQKPTDLARGDFRVYVSPNTERAERIDRSVNCIVDAVVDVGIFCQLQDLDTTTIDNAMLVLQQVASYSFDFGLTGHAAIWIKNDPIVWPDRMQIPANGTFFALWVATFQFVRRRRGVA